MSHGIVTRAVRLSAAAAYVLMIAVNALANLLPINGVTTGQVSDSYPNLFAPAGLTFAIWGLIYLLLAGFTLYQLGFFQDRRGLVKTNLLHKVALLFTVSSLANVAWIFSWHYRLIPLSMLFMIIILLSLILVVQTIGHQHLSQRERLLVRLPFSVYLGWITVATIANATVLLVSWGWQGFGLSEAVWAIIIILAGALIGSITTLRNRDSAYGLVLIWAYLGIVIKHTSAAGFAGQYPLVIAATALCLLIITAAVILAAYPRNRPARLRV